MTAAERERPPLEAMRILAQGTEVLGRRLPQLFLLAFVPAAAFTVFEYRLLRPLSGPGGAAWDYAVLALELGLSVLVGLFILAVLTLAAYDARLGRPPRAGHYLARAFRALPAIGILGLVTYLWVAVGLALFVLPGLYVAALLAVTTPAIVVEDAGFRGMRRSAELTAGYRWPIAGLFVAVLALAVLLDLGLTAGTMALLDGAPGEPGVVLRLLIEALAAALQFTLLAVFGAMLYARLREIRDGVGLDDLVEVFA